MKKILLTLGILALGGGSYVLLSSMRQPPQRLERPYLGPLVETIAAPAQKIQIVVDGQGTVRPGAQIDLVPQVSGVVVWKAPDFAPGGAFAKGDLLFRLQLLGFHFFQDSATDGPVEAFGPRPLF